MKRGLQLSTIAVFASALVLAVAAPALAQSAPTPPTADPCQSVAPSVFGGGGSDNILVVHNASSDGRLRIRGSVQLNSVPGPVVGSLNCAAALNGGPGGLVAPTPSLDCIVCQSVAVALQIDLISRSATRIAPRNVANAQNIRCTGCAAIALAMQDVVQVDDPSQVPTDANGLAQAMDDQLRQLQSDPNLTAAEAADRIIAVLHEFASLEATFDIQRSDATI
jgi:hypothetical protein